MGKSKIIVFLCMSLLLAGLSGVSNAYKLQVGGEYWLGQWNPDEGDTDMGTGMIGPTLNVFTDDLKWNVGGKILVGRYNADQAPMVNRYDIDLYARYRLLSSERGTLYAGIGGKGFIFEVPKNDGATYGWGPNLMVIGQITPLKSLDFLNVYLGASWSPATFFQSSGLPGDFSETTMTYSMESGFNINLGKGFSLKAGYRFQRIDGEIIDESFSGPTVGISYFF